MSNPLSYLLLVALLGIAGCVSPGFDAGRSMLSSWDNQAPHKAFQEAESMALDAHVSIGVPLDHMTYELAIRNTLRSNGVNLKPVETYMYPKDAQGLLIPRVSRENPTRWFNEVWRGLGKE